MLAARTRLARPAATFFLSYTPRAALISANSAPSAESRLFGIVWFFFLSARFEMHMVHVPNVPKVRLSDAPERTCRAFDMSGVRSVRAPQASAISGASFCFMPTT